MQVIITLVVCIGLMISVLPCSSITIIKGTGRSCQQSHDNIQTILASRS